MSERQTSTTPSRDRRLRRLTRIGLAAVLSLGAFAGNSYTAPPAEAIPPLRLPPGLVAELTNPAVRLPVKNTAIADSALQRIAQQARVPVARTSELVTTSEVRTASSWQTVRTSIGALNTATEGPLRSASVEAACTVLKGQTVTVDGFLGYVANAYGVELTRGQARQLVDDTEALITNLREAQRSPNPKDRVAVLLICYVAGAAL